MTRHDDDADNNIQNRYEMQRSLLPARAGGSPPETFNGVSRPPERRQKQQRADTVLGRWWSEILGCCFMFLALLATVVTLVLHHGRTIPEWPLAITVNATISIYASVLQMSMMYVLAQSLSQMKWVWFNMPRQLKDLETFDNASRGPWGAAKLIWILRASHAAALGALLIIASLAVGPFLQQIVSINSCQIIADDVQATIPRTNVYDASLQFESMNVDQGISTAIVKGLISQVANSSTVTPSCSTGNCTFQGYKSLGISSDCQDITDTLEIECSDISYESCTYKLNSGIGIQCDSTDNSQQLFIIASYTPNATWAFMGYEVISLNVTLEEDTQYNNSLNIKATAYRCQFGQSIGTYTASITNGHFEEVLYSTILASSSTGTLSLSGDKSTSQVMVELDCLSTFERGQLASLGHNMNDVSGFIVLNVTQNNNATEWNTTYAPLHCMYAAWDVEFITGFVNSFLLDGYSSTGYNEGTLNPSPELTIAMLNFLYLNGNNTLSSINDTMASIANSLTLVMRSTAPQGDTYYNAPAIGIAYRTEVCVQVQWEWLSLPVFLAIMAVLFFIFTLVAARGRRRGSSEKRNDWKTSIVALLFHGLDGRARERLGVLNYSSEMEKSAERLVVQLQCGSEGWQFVEIEKIKSSAAAEDKGARDAKRA